MVTIKIVQIFYAMKKNNYIKFKNQLYKKKPESYPIIRCYSDFSYKADLFLCRGG